MAETFKRNLMFLNNIPNKDVVVSHGLLALPSTSDSKPLDGEATAAPGEASFEGQHAALAALGQAVLAALGVAFFQGSTPIDVVGGYVFSLDVLGDALSLDVLTNSNVLHKTGFMGAAPTVVFLGGSEGLNALLLDASAAAALDGVFKGRFGVAALHGQPVVVDAAPDVRAAPGPGRTRHYLESSGSIQLEASAAGRTLLLSLCPRASRKSRLKPSTPG